MRSEMVLTFQICRKMLRKMFLIYDHHIHQIYYPLINHQSKTLSFEIHWSYASAYCPHLALLFLSPECLEFSGTCEIDLAWRIFSYNFIYTLYEDLSSSCTMPMAAPPVSITLHHYDHQKLYFNLLPIF